MMASMMNVPFDDPMKRNFDSNLGSMSPQDKRSKFNGNHNMGPNLYGHNQRSPSLPNFNPSPPLRQNSNGNVAYSPQFPPPVNSPQMGANGPFMIPPQPSPNGSSPSFTPQNWPMNLLPYGTPQSMIPPAYPFPLPAQSPFPSPLPSSASPNQPPLASLTGRTVYVGNLPSDASVDELLNLVRFGPIESVKILPEKSCAFISFLDTNLASAFHTDLMIRKVLLHGQDLKIGWGKVAPVSNLVLQAVQQNGATRNVYLG